MVPLFFFAFNRPHYQKLIVQHIIVKKWLHLFFVRRCKVCITRVFFEHAQFICDHTWTEIELRMQLYVNQLRHHTIMVWLIFCCCLNHSADVFVSPIITRYLHVTYCEAISFHYSIWVLLKLSQSNWQLLYQSGGEKKWIAITKWMVRRNMALAWRWQLLSTGGETTQHHWTSSDGVQWHLLCRDFSVAPVDSGHITCCLQPRIVCTGTRELASPKQRGFPCHLKA